MSIAVGLFDANPALPGLPESLDGGGGDSGRGVLGLKNTVI